MDNNSTTSVSLQKSRKVLPGEKLATIEEFSPGVGSALSGDAVISTVVGEASPDMASRVMNVSREREDSVGRIPKAGDMITGSVQSAQPSMVQVQIEAVNDVPSTKEFAGMLSLRDERRRRTTSPIKPGDIIRAKISSTKNAIFHLSVDCEDCGVLQTSCSICGSEVIAISRDRIKCKECGWVDERILSADFVKYSRSQSSS